MAAPKTAIISAKTHFKFLNNLNNNFGQFQFKKNHPILPYILTKMVNLTSKKKLKAVGFTTKDLISTFFAGFNSGTVGPFL